jgi:FlaA1/EpsC-like NDP-sugar epimerase
MRAFFRLYYSGPNSKKRKDILIIGAGSAGEQLVRDMVRSPRSSFLPVGFIDDNPKKKHTLIHGTKVLGAREDIPKVVKKSCKKV